MCRLYRLGLPLSLFMMLFMSISFASVKSVKEEAVNLKLAYPVVIFVNQKAQDKVNTDIQHRVQAFRAEKIAGKFIDGDFSFTTKYEDENYLSLLLCEYRYTGGAHGMPTYTGVTYNKQTGAVIPLTFFVHLRSEDATRILALPVYNWKNEVIPENLLNSYRDKEPLTGNYYLMGAGNIALIFQPYQLAAYAAGVTHIILTPALQKELNQQNS